MCTKIEKERKTFKSGIKFKPSVYDKLREIAKYKKTSIANAIELLILEEHNNNMKGGV